MQLLDVSYILPLKASVSQTAQLTPYLRSLSRLVNEILVVDGSSQAVYAQHAAAWQPFVRHLRPEVQTPMGKVGGVLTGLRHACHEHIILADDDIRYNEDTLRQTAALLEQAAVVRPQNVFRPRPWHARWDTGRTLLNRLWGGDWPGTLAVKRSVLEAAGGYRGDVMFENLELVRTVRAVGGHETVPLDLFVERRPPTVEHFLSQRVRQAYDEWARPKRFALQLSILPLVSTLVWNSWWKTLGLGILAVAGAAEAGRRRGKGRQAFASTAALWAPFWVSERMVTAWLALGTRLLLGGVSYRGGRLRDAATPLRVLQKRLANCRSTDQNLKQP